MSNISIFFSIFHQLIIDRDLTVNCSYTWSEWSPCNTSCFGVQTRRINIIAHPSLTGHPCPNATQSIQFMQCYTPSTCVSFEVCSNRNLGKTVNTSCHHLSGMIRLQAVCFTQCSFLTSYADALLLSGRLLLQYWVLS